MLTTRGIPGFMEITTLEIVSFLGPPELMFAPQLSGHAEKSCSLFLDCTSQRGSPVYSHLYPPVVSCIYLLSFVIYLHCKLLVTGTIFVFTVYTAPSTIGS